jgi:hypothetical protein
VYFDTLAPPGRCEYSQAGFCDTQATREAVAFAVLTILRSKYYRELFLKMENNRVRSAFIGWLGSYGTPHGEKQKGTCRPDDWGGFRIQEFMLISLWPLLSGVQNRLRVFGHNLFYQLVEPAKLVEPSRPGKETLVS